MRKEIERHIKWLMVFRVVVITTLLLSSFVIELLFSPTKSLQALYFLSVVTYLLAIAYGLLYPRLRNKDIFVYIQSIGDALVISGFVYITGGLDSPMSFLYILPIISASIMLHRKGTFAITASCFLLYLTLILLLICHVIPFYPTSYVQEMEITQQKIYFSLLVNLIGLLVVAYLSSYLSEKVRVAGRELQEKQDDFEELKAIHEKIIESINSGIITTDLSGKIVLINRSGMDLTGLSQDEVKGKNIKDLFDFDDSFLWKIRSILDEEKRYRFENIFQREEQHEKLLGFTASNLRNGGGRTLGLIFIFQDLTIIRAMEKQMRLKERMAALGEMAAGMAHELRNPLASISGSVQVLKSEMDGGGDARELMDIILRESERLDKTIKDFLMFAKPSQFSLERCDIVTLMRNSIRLLKNSKEFLKEHKIRTEFSHEEIICYVDINRMKQVFWNLATNALKAMTNGGTLTVEVDNRSKKSLEIIFSDEGIGMSEKETESYFQPFQGAFKEGTGLGAAIVYKIIQEHGGWIDIKSHLSEGASIKITIPKKSDEIDHIPNALKSQTTGIV